jgi:Ribosomal protein L7/L12 C-terminal domain
VNQGEADFPNAMPAAVADALRKGHKIEAIRLYREHAGVGLKEAKQAVEAYAATHPVLREGLSPGQVAGSGTGTWIVVAIAVAAALGYWFLR